MLGQFDSFLRACATKRSDGGLYAPAQLVSLLPPPPAAGWPEEFALTKAVVALRNKAASQRSFDMFDERDDPEPYVPHSPELYPSRRRAQRLSFALWTLIRQENRDLQPILEVQSTSDRLRMAILRLRELRRDILDDSE